MAKDHGKEFLAKLGENLKAARTSKGLSLRGLAALCRIDHGDISKMESGERNITMLTLLELAEALEVKPKKLLDFEI